MLLSGLIARLLLQVKRDEVFRRRLRGFGFPGFLLALSLHALSASGQLSTRQPFANQLYWIRYLRAVSWLQSRCAEEDADGACSYVQLTL